MPRIGYIIGLASILSVTVATHAGDTTAKELERTPTPGHSYPHKALRYQEFGLGKRKKKKKK